MAHRRTVVRSYDFANSLLTNCANKLKDSAVTMLFSIFQASDRYHVNAIVPLIV